MRQTIKDPVAPTAADSVGVAIPKKIEPNTAITMKAGRKISLRDSHLFFQLICSAEVGAKCG